MATMCNRQPSVFRPRRYLATPSAMRVRLPPSPSCPPAGWLQSLRIGISDVRAPVQAASAMRDALRQDTDRCAAEAARGAPAGARPAGSATSLQGQIATACRLRQAATADSMRIQRQGNARCAGARAGGIKGGAVDQCADQRRRECGQAGRATARAPAPQPRRKDGGGRGRRAGGAPTPSGRPAPAPTRGPAGSRRPRTGSGP